MAVELLLVFALGAPPSGAALQAALDREPDSVHIANASSLNLAQQTGFLPVTYRSFATGFYVYQSSPEEFLTSHPDVKGRRGPIQAVLSFQVSGDPGECVAAMRVAYVLANDFGAEAFDPQGGVFMTVENLRSVALACANQAQIRGAKS
jgi:hypothetical protein